MRARVLVIHDHRLFVSGLELLLAPEFDVVLATTDYTTAVTAALDLRPDLLLIGLSKDPQAGLQIISEVHRRLPSLPIAVVSRWEDGALAADALRRGALAYTLKTSTESDFFDGLHAAMERRVYVSPGLVGNVIHAFDGDDKRETHVLTERQIEIVKLLAAGKTMKEVAVTMNLAPRTVAFHKYAAMKRINVRTSAELVRFAVEQGLV